MVDRSGEHPGSSDALSASASHVEPLSEDPGVRVTKAAVGSEVLLIVSVPVSEWVPDELTPAEQDVFAALLAGQSNAEIGDRRGTSKRTVANQIASIFRKLRVSSRAELLSRRPVVDD